MTHRLAFAAAAPLFLAAFTAAPAMAQTESPWSGFYVGANLGGAWGDSSVHTNVSPGPGTPHISAADANAINAAGSHGGSESGFTGGIEAGYNYQAGPWLFGLETDWGAMDLSHNNTHTATSALLIAPPITYTVHDRLSTDWIWTLRPRLGYASGPWLVYGTGGIAITNVKHSFNYADTRTPAGVVSGSNDETRTGWVAGLGGAYAFTPQWSVKGEWLYADFGNTSATRTTPDGFATISSEADVKANLFRVGVDYRF